MRFCETEKRAIKSDEFYKTNDLERYPDGKLCICKKCLTMEVDNWEPDTFLWILKECDVPYIPSEWSKLMEKYCKDPSKVTGTTILGRYLSKMRLKKFKEYRWKDTEFLKKLADNDLKQAMKNQGYSAAEITEKLSQTAVTIPKEGYGIPQNIKDGVNTADSIYNKDSLTIGMPPKPLEPIPEQAHPSFAKPQEDFSLGLTEEETTMLRLKWGKTYRAEEWIRLEQLYEEMKRSYDIVGAGHEDVLKLICKTSLKSNQLLDIGDKLNMFP